MLPHRGLPGRLEALRRFLPRGEVLSPAAWGRRHNAVMAIVAAHIPVLFAVASHTGLDPTQPVAASLVVGVTLFVAWRAPTRMVGMSAAAIALLTCSAALIVLSQGTPLVHFHLFLAVGLISIYQSWQVLLLGLAFICLELGLVGAIAPTSLYNPRGDHVGAGWWVAIDGVFALGAAAIHLTFWSLQERAHARAEEYYRQLYEGEQAVSSYLRSSQQLKDQLVSTVSHEFRTPLTCILGFARTLSEHGEDVPAELRTDFVDRIVGHGERLHRLVENLLVASQVVEPDRNAVAEVRSQLMAVTTELGKAGHEVESTIERGELRVRMGQDSLYHVLYNLLENGVKFSRHGTLPRVAVWRSGDEVVIEVANQGPPISLSDQVRIFDPFVQVDGSSTRAADGLGMGLAVVRTLVEAHGGEVGVRSDAAETVFWMRLANAARVIRRYAPGSCTQPPADSTWSNSSTATG